jgi:putative peptidoglycan lipid II flippase
MSRIARATLIIAVFFGLEKVLGFIRQVAIARAFGLSPALDAFYAANNLPDLIFALISGGALAVAFIPVLSEYLEQKGRAEAWDLFSRIANLVFLVTAALSIQVALFADQLVSWRLGIAPGFGAEQQALVASLMRLNLFATLLLSLGGLVIAGLQANQHFLLPAMAPSMYDLGTLFGVFILAPETGYQIGPITLPAFGLGIYGLVYGTILGAGLFLLIQVPGLLRYGFRWTPRIGIRGFFTFLICILPGLMILLLSLGRLVVGGEKFRRWLNTVVRHPGVLQVLFLLVPRILTVFFIQITFLAQDNIASRLVTGTVSALVYGWLFMQVPETIIGTALGTALLPTLSEQMVRDERAEFRQSLNRVLRVILALTIPLGALIAIGIPPVVEILGFDAAGSSMVVWTARAYLLGLIGHSLLEVSARAFYAQQNARTPLVAAGLTAVAFVLLAFLLGRRMGAPGIALANSLAFTAEALVLWVLLAQRFSGLLELGSTLLRATLAAALGGLVVYGLMSLWESSNPDAGLLLATGVALVSIGLGALVALPFVWREIRLLVRL